MHALDLDRSTKRTPTVFKINTSLEGTGRGSATCVRFWQHAGRYCYFDRLRFLSPVCHEIFHRLNARAKSKIDRKASFEGLSTSYFVTRFQDLGLEIESLFALDTHVTTFSTRPRTRTDAVPSPPVCRSFGATLTALDMFAAGAVSRPAGLAFRAASPVPARITRCAPSVSPSRRTSGVIVYAGKKQKVKKMKASQMNKKRQEFIEMDDEKDALAAQMRKAAAAASRIDRSVDDDEEINQSPQSFEDKLAAVREQGKVGREAKAAAAPTVMDDIIAGGQGGRKLGSIYDKAPETPSGLTFSQVGAKTDEDEGLNTLVRVGSGILAIGLLLVFLPSDLTAQAPIPQKDLSPEVLEQVRDRAAEYEKQLLTSDNSEDVIAGLKGAAESYVVLEDYAAAAPLLQRLNELQPSIENTGNLADVWNAAGKPSKASEAYRIAVNADWSGDKPSPTLLKGLVDSLSKDGRYGLALSYVNDWREKQVSDDVDATLLTARIYSGWKGHGKDAEENYTKVIAEHPDDFRGYLAKGVFFREIGKPQEAENLFRQAKVLAPKGETLDLVNVVVSQAKMQN